MQYCIGASKVSIATISCPHYSSRSSGSAESGGRVLKPKERCLLGQRVFVLGKEIFTNAPPYWIDNTYSTAPFIARGVPSTSIIAGDHIISREPCQLYGGAARSAGLRTTHLSKYKLLVKQRASLVFFRVRVTWQWMSQPVSFDTRCFLPGSLDRLRQIYFYPLYRGLTGWFNSSGPVLHYPKKLEALLSILKVWKKGSSE